jgi:hypothetical protein
MRDAAGAPPLGGRANSRTAGAARIYHVLMDDKLFGSLFEQSAAGIAVFSIGGRFLRDAPAGEANVETTSTRPRSKARLATKGSTPEDGLF